MKTLKHIFALAALMTWVIASAQAQEITQELKPFTKIITSPHVNLVLEQGDREGIRVVYNDIAQNKINIQVKGHTLHVYLDDARVTDKLERIDRRQKQSIYRNASVTAYVTYKELKQLQVRGSQEVICNNELIAKKFKLKAYGENQIEFASLKSENFKTSLYGENTLKIKGGRADYTKYKLYGENKIDTRDLTSYSATTTIFGESRVKLTTEDELKVNAFGEADVRYNGNASVNRGLVFGETKITRMN
jgi:hypothetical protein